MTTNDVGTSLANWAIRWPSNEGHNSQTSSNCNNFGNNNRSHGWGCVKRNPNQLETNTSSNNNSKNQANN